MASNGSFTATMSQRDSLASSQLLSQSVSSRQASSQISKIYRQASTLFLTRRLPESLSTILPVITSPAADQDLNGNSPATEPAPIASASRTTRIKVWSLYLTILNAVVELEPEEGKQAFGTQEWRQIASKVRDGDVWEEVVKNGYGGLEGDVDADVVINLATLLLAHARTQILNQQRLENYLALATQPNLDISARLQDPRSFRKESNSGRKSGTDTPRDLNARVKILELYTLHVLLRNNEWDYSREFITMSEVLDEERREAFLQALQSLQDEQNEQSNRELEAQREQEEQLQKDLDEARRRRIENEEREKERHRQEQESRSSKKASSELDYGIETSYPNGSTNGSPKARLAKASLKSSRTGASTSHASRPSIPGKKVIVTPGMMQRAGNIIANLRKLLENMSTSFKTNPMVMLRLLAFAVALLLALSRQDVKNKLKQIMSKGWNKVRATAGMGVKVSYI